MLLVGAKHPCERWPILVGLGEVELGRASTVAERLGASRRVRIDVEPMGSKIPIKGAKIGLSQQGDKNQDVQSVCVTVPSKGVIKDPFYDLIRRAYRQVDFAGFSE